MPSDVYLHIQKACVTTCDLVYQLHMETRGWGDICKILLAKTEYHMWAQLSLTVWGRASSRRHAFCLSGGRCTLLALLSASDICPHPSGNDTGTYKGKK